MYYYVVTVHSEGPQITCYTVFLTLVDLELQSNWTKFYISTKKLQTGRIIHATRTNCGWVLCLRFKQLLWRGPPRTVENEKTKYSIRRYTHALLPNPLLQLAYVRWAQLPPIASLIGQPCRDGARFPTSHSSGLFLFRYNRYGNREENNV